MLVGGITYSEAFVVFNEGSIIAVHFVIKATGVA